MKKRIGLILTILGLFQINNLYSSQADLVDDCIYGACKAVLGYVIEVKTSCDIYRRDLNELADEYNSLGCGSSPECTENIRARHRLLVILRDQGCLRSNPSSSANSSHPLVTTKSDHLSTSPTPSTGSPKPPTTSINDSMVLEAPLSPLN